MTSKGSDTVRKITYKVLGNKNPY